MANSIFLKKLYHNKRYKLKFQFFDDFNTVDIQNSRGHFHSTFHPGSGRGDMLDRNE